MICLRCRDEIQAGDDWEVLDPGGIHVGCMTLEEFRSGEVELPMVYSFWTQGIDGWFYVPHPGRV